MLRIACYIFCYTFALALDKGIVFYEPTQKSLVVIFQGKDLHFQEQNNQCISFIEGTLQVFDEQNTLIYEKIFQEKFLLNEQNNLPDDEELFVRKYILPALPPSALIYVFFDDREKPFTKFLRPSYKKSFVQWKLKPDDFATAFFLSEFPVMSSEDTLKLNARKQDKNSILLVSLLFAEKNKFVEIASYSWYLRKKNNFSIPLQLFSEGKYTLLVFSENKKDILLKKDFFIFSPLKFQALHNPKFVQRIQNYYSQVFHKKLPTATTKKNAEEFFTQLLHYDLQDTSLKQFVATFSGRLTFIKRYKQAQLYSQEPNDFYYIIDETPHYENIRIP